MIRLCFYENNGRLTGFSSRGHSGYAAAGQDIVCAMVSAAVMIAECAINDVAKAGAAVSVCEKSTSVSLFLPKVLTEKQEIACQTALRSFYKTMQAQSREYRPYIQVSLIQSTGEPPKRRKKQ